MAKIRERRERENRCLWCEAPRLAGHVLCRAHLIRAGRPPTVDVVHPVVHKAERIAAATRRHPDGRVRYHGKRRRGQQTHAVQNQQDVEMADHNYVAFKAGLDLLGAEEAKAWHRGERVAMIAAICSQAERHIRHLEDVLERLGYFGRSSAARPDRSHGGDE